MNETVILSQSGLSPGLPGAPRDCIYGMFWVFVVCVSTLLPHVPLNAWGNVSLKLYTCHYRRRGAGTVYTCHYRRREAGTVVLTSRRLSLLTWCPTPSTVCVNLWVSLCVYFSRSFTSGLWNTSVKVGKCNGCSWKQWFSFILKGVNPIIDEGLTVMVSSMVSYYGR